MTSPTTGSAMTDAERIADLTARLEVARQVMDDLGFRFVDLLNDRRLDPDEQEALAIARWEEYRTSPHG